MRRYLDTFFRYWYVALIPLVLLPVGEYLVMHQTPKSVTASTNILVGQAVGGVQTDGSQWLSPAQNAQATFTQWLQSPSFDLAVAEASPAYAQLLHTRPAERDNVYADLSANTVVTVKGNSMVNIAYTSKDWLVAQQVVPNILSEARQRLRSLDQQNAQANVAYYTSQLRVAKQKESQSAKALADYLAAHNIARNQVEQVATGDPTLATLNQQNLTDRQDVLALQQKIASFQWQNTASTLAADQGPYLQVDPVNLTIVKTTKKTLTSVLLAFAIGLLLGGGFIVAKTALDSSLRFPEEVPSLLDLPVLAVVPLSPHPGRERAGREGSGGAPSPRKTLTRLRRTG